MAINPILLVPVVLGFLLHWAKKYWVDDAAPEFWAWFFTNIPATLGAFSASLVLAGIFLDSNPGGITAPNIGTWIGLTMISFSADSTINSAAPPSRGEPTLPISPTKPS